MRRDAPRARGHVRARRVLGRASTGEWLTRARARSPPRDPRAWKRFGGLVGPTPSTSARGRARATLDGPNGARKRPHLNMITAAAASSGQILTPAMRSRGARSPASQTAGSAAPYTINTLSAGSRCSRTSPWLIAERTGVDGPDDARFAGKHRTSSRKPMTGRALRLEDDALQPDARVLRRKRLVESRHGAG